MTALVNKSFVTGVIVASMGMFNGDPRRQKQIQTVRQNHFAH